MKEIMAKESSDSEQGVPSFEYNPAPDRQLSYLDTHGHLTIWLTCCWKILQVER